MTESEWLECTDVATMLACLGKKASERKLRLFACGCCRYQCHLLVQECGPTGLVSLAERDADGQEVSYDERGTARARQRRIVGGDGRNKEEWEWARDAARAIGGRSSNIADSLPSVLTNLHRCHRPGEEPSPCCLEEDEPGNGKPNRHDILFREVFGNPFRNVTISTACLDLTVTGLARTAYDDRILPSGELELDRLAVLSDALEESGCDDEEILNHLRGPGPHVRGCWVVDLLLGKS